MNSEQKLEAILERIAILETKVDAILGSGDKWLRGIVMPVAVAVITALFMRK